ncbi:unnamed protein product [Linum trigynum]|uniref:Uncharacterized protein n=1 Tax=Linum trigynum TaxID=586398 RepID=A0AAV2GEI7_9ROSI
MAFATVTSLDCGSNSSKQHPTTVWPSLPPSPTSIPFTMSAWLPQFRRRGARSRHLICFPWMAGSPILTFLIVTTNLNPVPNTLLAQPRFSIPSVVMTATMVRPNPRRLRRRLKTTTTNFTGTMKMTKIENQSPQLVETAREQRAERGGRWRRGTRLGI